MRVQNMPFFLPPCHAAVLWLASGALSMRYAQVATNITPTGAGDLGTTVTQAGPSFDITGGTRPNNGPNLFHSFGAFSVGTGDTANFMNDSALATENILSRVTGGNPSNIFGTLQTTGFSGADLYLVNPNGVLFGPGASLSVEGGFHVSTADFIELADGVRFDATPSPNDALLSVAPPAAFGFLDDTPGPARIMDVTEGDFSFPLFADEFSIVGGDIAIANSELGALGVINIASVASPGKVVPVQVVDEEGFIVARSLEVSDQTQLGNVTISQGSTILADAGDVVIRGGRLALTGSQVSATGEEIRGCFNPNGGLYPSRQQLHQYGYRYWANG